MQELFGCSDLVVVANGVLFYLGDTRDGSTLVGLNLTDGTEVCSNNPNPNPNPNPIYQGMFQACRSP